MAKKKKSSSSSFSFKNFFIMHVEKLVFSFIALLAAMLMYFGFTAKTFPSSKTPKALQDTATQVSNDLKKDHWEVMKTEEGRKVDPVFLEAANKSLSPVDPIPYITDITGVSKTKPGAKRGDPVLEAPSELEVKYYFGPIIVATNGADPLASLDDAKRPEAKPGRNQSGGGSPFGGPPGGAGGPPGPGMGSEGEGGGAMGFGGGMGFGGAMANPALRMLSPGYDLGFKFGMNTFLGGMGPGGMPGGMGGMPGGPGGMPGGVGGMPGGPGGMPGGVGGMPGGPGGMPGGVGGMPGGPGTGPDGGAAPRQEFVPKKYKAEARGFVAVTALAPHLELEKGYKKEFYDVIGYQEGRDTPNYVGIEVQRAEVTDATKQIAEGDWQLMPDIGSSKYKEIVKKLVGTCSEVHPVQWTDPNISMPIPPVLLSDFNKLASHSAIQREVEKEAELAMANSMGGFGGGGFPGGGFPGGGYPGGMSGGGFTEGGSSGESEGGMPGMSGGMPGMSGGMPGKFGGGPPGGMSGGGFTEGGEGGGMFGGGDGGFGGMGQQMELPKKLPSTKYKLVRFFDFSAKPDKVYKYRVRLLMYDSNYPEWSAYKPTSSTLKTDALRRVQGLESNEPKEPVKKSSTPIAAAPKKRVSSRPSPWSEPSKAVLIKKPAMVYASEVKDKMELVFVDFEKGRSIHVPTKVAVEKGYVFGAVSRTKGKDLIDIIHPVTKIIKALKDYKPSNFLTIVNAKDQVPLAVANAKDPLKTGAEVVAFDPLTGQLSVSREFDSFVNFHMFTQPDLPVVGPFGGGAGLATMPGGPGGPPGGDGFGGEGMGGEGGGRGGKGKFGK